jgi:glycerate 2-kinase
MVVAIGKAARPMAVAAIGVLGEQVVGGVLVAPDAEALDPLEVHVGSHPLPDEGSLHAGRAVLEAVQRSGHDHLLVLLSGGGSAMAEVPKHPLNMESVADITDRLMRAGTPIEELNVVRRHLSQLKHCGVSGRSKVPVTTLLISDVTDGPASTVASVPTLHDDTTALQALAIIERRLGRPVPTAVHTALATPIPRRPNETVHVVADRHTAFAAAAHALATAGLGTAKPIRLEGDAVDMTHTMLSVPGLAVGTGETTVTVTGEGRGGRNQHAALVAAITLAGRSAVFGTLGTDGVDGPTNAAGAVVDGTTFAAMQQAGIDPQQALDSCDSHTALDAAGVLIRTGPTGTNVADVWVSYVETNR